MHLGQYIRSGTIDTSPWFSRQGDRATVHCHVEQFVVATNFQLIVQVETKTLDEDDAQAVTSGNMAPFTNVGRKSLTVSGLKELVRFRFHATSSSSTTAFVYFRMFSPTWETNTDLGIGLEDLALAESVDSFPSQNPDGPPASSDPTSLLNIPSTRRVFDATRNVYSQRPSVSKAAVAGGQQPGYDSEFDPSASLLGRDVNNILGHRASTREAMGLAGIATGPNRLTGSPGSPAARRLGVGGHPGVASGGGGGPHAMGLLSGFDPGMIHVIDGRPDFSHFMSYETSSGWHYYDSSGKRISAAERAAWEERITMLARMRGERERAAEEVAKRLEEDLDRDREDEKADKARQSAPTGFLERHCALCGDPLALAEGGKLCENCTDGRDPLSYDQEETAEENYEGADRKGGGAGEGGRDGPILPPGLREGVGLPGGSVDPFSPIEFGLTVKSIVASSIGTAVVVALEDNPVVVGSGAGGARPLIRGGIPGGEQDPIVGVVSASYPRPGSYRLRNFVELTRRRRLSWLVPVSPPLPFSIDLPLHPSTRMGQDWWSTDQIVSGPVSVPTRRSRTPKRPSLTDRVITFLARLAYEAHAGKAPAEIAIGMGISALTAPLYGVDFNVNLAFPPKPVIEFLTGTDLSLNWGEIARQNLSTGTAAGEVGQFIGVPVSGGGLLIVAQRAGRRFVGWLAFGQFSAGFRNQVAIKQMFHMAPKGMFETGSKKFDDLSRAAEVFPDEFFGRKWSATELLSYERDFLVSASDIKGVAFDITGFRKWGPATRDPGGLTLAEVTMVLDLAKRKGLKLRVTRQGFLPAGLVHPTTLTEEGRRRFLQRLYERGIDRRGR